ncbi:hypothetical protein [Bradyrhizobium sp. Leo121]|uniref:hypothetical protein n=1 Tax=Bradyrhizobium sp. Leo121 TaxID=1571195 RepID=UPI0013EF2656|nr:hypothetical protein [Bradyrhizobium sp. Leo121]
MIVTMTVVWMMESPIDKIVDVVPVRDCLMPAARPVSMIGAGDVWRAMHRVGFVNGDHMLINMISMHVVQMTVVQVIRVGFVPYRRMPTARAVLMGMVGVFRFSASRHILPPIKMD